MAYGVEERVQQSGMVAPNNAKFVLIALVMIVWAILYRQLLSILASWLYARASLGAKVTFTEARELRKLFQLDFSFHWIPLKELKKLPREQRHDAVLQALDAYSPHRKKMLI